MNNKFYKSLKLSDVKKETTVTEDIEEYISNYIKNLPIEKQIQNVLISLRKDCKNILNNYEMVVRERDELSKKLDKECNISLNIEGQLHDMTKQRDSLIKDVEKLRNWFKLKENIKHMIISVYPEVKEHVVDYEAGQFNILEELGSQIDELEGNHDIQNLLDDLGRE